MPRDAFFASISRIDQWAGNLFARGVSPLEIESMRYDQLKYWNGWNEKMREAEQKVIDSAKGK